MWYVIIINGTAVYGRWLSLVVMTKVRNPSKFTFLEVLGKYEKRRWCAMTTYETVMVVLTCLTLVVSLMMLVIKLLLIIIDKSEKKITTSPSGKVWVSYFNKNTKSKDNRLLAVPFLNYIIVYTKLKVNIPKYCVIM